MYLFKAAKDLSFVQETWDSLLHPWNLDSETRVGVGFGEDKIDNFACAVEAAGEQEIG
jgi:hypothetical protein